VANAGRTVKQIIQVEAALFLGLLLFGLVVLPTAIYVVGGKVFGEYGAPGFGGFFGDLGSRIRSGDAVAWFLVLSPYLVWQVLRLAIAAWHLAGRRSGDDETMRS
jgi:hypothetical protein